MKKLIFCLTIAAFASVASLQAGEGKECAGSKCCTETKVAKASECSKSASSCCASQKTDATSKGATKLMLIAKR